MIKQSALPGHVHDAVFLNILVGGIGAAAGRECRRVFEAEERPFAQWMLQIDTHADEECPADSSCVLKTTAQDMEALIANAPVFGSVAEDIVDRLANLLRPSDILNGARTTRPLTQLMFLAQQRRVCEAIRDAVTQLRHQTRFTEVRPVIIGSSGGGTGSALQVLLLQAFNRPSFRRRLLLGEDDPVFLPPISFVVEPFHYARCVADTQAQKILANAAAFRIETESLLQRGLGPDYVFHLGYSNDKGSVIDSPEGMGRTLGECVYQVERLWPDFKKHWVDNVDSNSVFMRYRGVDTVRHLSRKYGF